MQISIPALFFLYGYKAMIEIIQSDSKSDLKELKDILQI